mgnify:CR=1 FL=1
MTRTSFFLIVIIGVRKGGVTPRAAGFFAFLCLLCVGVVRSLRPGATSCPGSSEAGTIISAIVALPLPPCPSAFLAFLPPCRARSQWRLCQQNQIHQVCAAPGRDPQGMTAVQELCGMFPTLNMMQVSCFLNAPPRSARSDRAGDVTSPNSAPEVSNVSRAATDDPCVQVASSVLRQPGAPAGIATPVTDLAWAAAVTSLCFARQTRA